MGLSFLACGVPLPTTPSPLIPCNAADLIAAINAANADPDHTSIYLPDGCTITLSTVNNNDGGHGENGLPVITTPITIESGGTSSGGGIASPSATVERSMRGDVPDFRIFFITSSGQLTLRHVYVKNGRASDGAGVFNDGGTLRLEDRYVAENLASGNGGGIYTNGG